MDSRGPSAVTAPRAYGTPASFRRALTDKLRALAETSRWNLPQLQRQMAYDRLLERLYLVDDDWIVKGATALLARDIGVRGTIDVDIYRHAGTASAQTALREAARQDLGDWFRFEVGAARTASGAAGGFRLPVRSFIGPTLWVAFHVDLVSSEIRMTGEPELVPPLARVLIPQVEQHGYRAYPLVDHVADKIAAMFERHGTGRAPSTRYKDLVDLVSIVIVAQVDGEPQLAALQVTRSAGHYGSRGCRFESCRARVWLRQSTGADLRGQAPVCCPGGGRRPGVSSHRDPRQSALSPQPAAGALRRQLGEGSAPRGFRVARRESQEQLDTRWGVSRVTIGSIEPPCERGGVHPSHSGLTADEGKQRAPIARLGRRRRARALKPQVGGLDAGHDGGRRAAWCRGGASRRRPSPGGPSRSAWSGRRWLPRVGVRPSAGTPRSARAGDGTALPGNGRRWRCSSTPYCQPAGRGSLTSAWCTACRGS